MHTMTKPDASKPTAETSGGKGPRHDSCHNRACRGGTTGTARASRNNPRYGSGRLLSHSSARSLGRLRNEAASLLRRPHGLGRRRYVYRLGLRRSRRSPVAYGPRAVHDIWADDDTTRLCSSLVGRAELVEGGVKPTGDWRFSSGCDHAKWALLGAVVRTEPGETPDIRLFMVPHTEYQISDTWFVSGLCATGSQDILVNGL